MTRCWSTAPTDRPTLQAILKQLRAAQRGSANLSTYSTNDMSTLGAAAYSAPPVVVDNDNNSTSSYGAPPPLRSGSETLSDSFLIAGRCLLFCLTILILIVAFIYSWHNNAIG
jgi:hypothetical protein